MDVHYKMRSSIMRVLEAIAGIFIGLVTLLILVVGGIFAFGSMGRIVKNKNM
jgi:hypothetical protein